MPEFNKPSELFDFLKETGDAALPMRQELAHVVGTDICYFEGIQYVQNTRRPLRSYSSGQTTIKPDYSPDSDALRVVDNQLTMHVQKSAAATNPERIEFDATPPDFAIGPDSAHAAGVHESAIAAEVKSSGYVQASRSANHRRCIAGTWGIGLCLEQRDLSTAEGAMPSSSLRAFSFDPTCLVTDPKVQNLNLWEHDWVRYEDVWTLAEIERAYGIKLNPNDCGTIEQLEPIKVEMAGLTEGRMFSKYKQDSRSKAARISQLHCKDGSGRWGKWYVVVEPVYGEKKWVNEDDPECPFGGGGLPFVLLHGHWRGDSMWSWGDTRQIRDEQDKRNLAATLFWRIVKKYSADTRYVDKRAFGSRATDADIARRFTNAIGGVIPLELSDKNRNIQYPVTVSSPPPPPFLEQSLDRFSQAMRDKTHRAGAHYGEQPTHVPFKTTERVLEEADQPMGMRVSLDIEAHEYLIRVMHGTTLKLAQQQNPATLMLLKGCGFEGEEFGVVASSDPFEIGVDIRVRPSTIRARSYRARKQDLDFAVVNQVITPDEYIVAAGEDLDAPITPQFRKMQLAAQKETLAILSGGKWEPKPLGRWSHLFIEAFKEAMFGPVAKRNKLVLTNLVEAVELQQEYEVQSAMRLDPKLRMEAAQLAQPAPEPQALSRDEQLAQAGSVGDILSVLEQPEGAPA